jgi:hypothetical protein
MIILGDFGVLWNEKPSDTERWQLDWFENKPWTTVIVDGNHESHFRLSQLPVETKFGGPVGKVRDSIFFLKRGYIYTINGVSFWTMGGAESVDKDNRVENISWWKEELPSFTEMVRGRKALQEAENVVDFVITHDCPTKVYDDLYDSHHCPSRFSDYLNTIDNVIDYQMWFFGHHHRNIQINEKYMCLYGRIVEIGG